MPLSAGSVSIHPTTGAVSGSGYARDCYDAEVAATPSLTGDLVAAVAGLAWSAAQLLAFRSSIAAKRNAQAAATVALVGTGTVVVPPGDAGGTFPVV